MWQYLPSLSPKDIVISALDIIIVAYVLYRFFLFIRGTRAVQLIKGVILLLVAIPVAQLFQLKTIYWLLQQATVMLVVALPIVFQPELRRALEHVGRGRFFARTVFSMQEEELENLIRETVDGVERLARKKAGALIVLERSTGLGEVAETGIEIDAVMTAELLINIFIPESPLHDGAVVIRGNRILAASCFLPLTESQNVPTGLGGRHRAALGITEHSDALAIVVSEETGGISLANAGKLIRNLDTRTLEDLMSTLIRKKGEARPFHFLKRGSS